MRERKNTKKNVVIKTITPDDAAEKLIVGRTFYDFASIFANFIAKHPYKLGVIILVLLTAISVAALQGVTLRFDNNWRPVVGVSPEDIQKRKDRIDEIVKKGKEKGLAFIILSITDRISIERESLNQVKPAVKIHESRIYVLKALRNIKKTETVFTERYTNTGRSADRVPGSNREIFQTGGNWSVELEAEEGEIVTFWTGAVFSLDLPLAVGRLAMGEQIRLGDNELFLSYQNENDLIGEILIQLESTSFRLAPVGKRAARKFQKEEDKYMRGEVYQPESSESILITSLSARWSDISPQDEVGIYFRMENPSQPPIIHCEKPHAKIRVFEKKNKIGRRAITSFASTGNESKQ